MSRSNMIIIGEPNVGKKTFIKRVMGYSFDEEYNLPTIDYCEVLTPWGFNILKYDNIKILKKHIEENNEIIKKYKVVSIMLDYTNVKTFNNVNKYIKIIKNIKNIEKTILLINKYEKKTKSVYRDNLIFPFISYNRIIYNTEQIRITSKYYKGLSLF